MTFGTYPYKGKKCFVFTSNDYLTNDENVEFISNIEEFIKNLISSSDGNIWLVGGSELLSIFLQHKSIDEIILSIIPIILGKGITLFQNIRQEVNLELITTIQYDRFVELTYKVLK